MKRRNFTKRLGGLALLTVVAAVAVAPATALAQDALSNPSDAQYQPQSQVQRNEHERWEQPIEPSGFEHRGLNPDLGAELERRFAAVHGYGRDCPRARGCRPDWYRRRVPQAVAPEGPPRPSLGNNGGSCLPQSARGMSPRGDFPYLSGLSAQRKVEFLTLRLRPALTGGLIAWYHFRSEWQGLLVFACMFASVMLLRRPRYPLHLIPLASAILYLLAPPIGALAAVLVSLSDGSPGTVTLGHMVAPVCGAWVVTAIGAWITYRFRAEP